MNQSLKNVFAHVAKPYIDHIREFVTKHQDKEVSKVTLGQLYGGMRGVISLTTETSLLDSEQGIRFRGNSIDDIYRALPKIGLQSKEPNAEIIFFLMLIGRLPNELEVKALSQEWHKRSELPGFVIDVVRSFPKDSHPMVVFTTALAALQRESVFNDENKQQINKNNQWEYTYEDAMNLLGKLPRLVAYIYNWKYKDGKLPDSDTNLDWAGNLVYMIGDKSDDYLSINKEFMRMYVFLHSDHEGGNGSAFTCHVVGSTLVSPYGAFAAAMQSLAGPLHGLACQTSLDWIKKMVSDHGNKKLADSEISDYINQILSEGKVVPGYGHAVLRKTDPRFIAQMNFAKKHNMTDILMEAVWSTYKVAPSILGGVAKIKNPYPNVDSHSGVMLNHLGYHDTAFYTVFFGLARALGVLASQIWDRAFNLPLHRPKSVTSEWVEQNFS